MILKIKVFGKEVSEPGNTPLTPISFKLLKDVIIHQDVEPILGTHKDYTRITLKRKIDQNCRRVINDYGTITTI